MYTPRVFGHGGHYNRSVSNLYNSGVENSTIYGAFAVEVNVPYFYIKLEGQDFNFCGGPRCIFGFS